MALSLAGRSLISITDLAPEEIYEVLRLASAQKSGQPPRQELLSTAPGRTLALLFDKSSLRTRVGFEVAMAQLGGHAIYVAPGDVRLGKREPVRDAARVFGRMVDAIAARLSSHEAVVELAAHAGVPVINAMSDLEHPCQALADALTIMERKGRMNGIEVAWIGDGYNVCHSLMLICAALGANMRVATPATYEPRPEIVQKAEAAATRTGASLAIGNEPQEAAKGADAIVTDVWVSAGQEEQATRRRTDFEGFQVNAELLSAAAPEAIVMHCLPAHRGEEITDEVIEGPQSAVFDEAENRLHTQRALLAMMLG
jgi:ornithine carbamoyltransferase